MMCICMMIVSNAIGTFSNDAGPYVLADPAALS